MGGICVGFFINLPPRVLLLFGNPNCYSDTVGTPPSLLRHMQEIVAHLLFKNQR